MFLGLIVLVFLNTNLLYGVVQIFLLPPQTKVFFLVKAINENAIGNRLA